MRLSVHTLNAWRRRIAGSGLYAQVISKLQQNPRSGHLFLFANKRRDRMEKSRLHWPVSAAGRVQLSREEFALLVGGIDLTETSKRNWCRRPIAEDPVVVRNTL